LVAKLVSDPAYERAYRYGWFSGSLEDFQHAAGAQLAALRAVRSTALRTAKRIVVPSRYLAEIARGWLRDPRRLEVLLNPAPAPSHIEPAALEPDTFVYVGRLTTQKGLDTLLDAVGAVDGARLELVGDGPERPRLEAAVAAGGLSERVRFAG